MTRFKGFEDDSIDSWRNYVKSSPLTSLSGVDNQRQWRHQGLEGPMRHQGLERKMRL